jgi:hypothetical protein
MQDLVGLFQLIIGEFFFMALPSAIGGISAALFSLYYSEQKDKTNRIKAMRDRLTSEISLLDASIRILLDGTANGKQSFEAVRQISLQTAQSIMNTFRLHSEATDAIPWGELMAFAHGLVLLSVKGWEFKQGMKWFMNTAKELADQSVSFMQYS